MRRLLTALAACALLSTPAAALAQSVQQQPNVRPIPPHVKPLPPDKRPHPRPTGGYAHRAYSQYPNVYPVVVLPSPTPAPKHKPAARPKNNGQDVFETHSSDDAK